MRTTLRGKITLLFMVLAMLLALPATALADRVENDVVVGGNDTITAGGSTDITYHISSQPFNLDGQRGCNASDGSPAYVTITAPEGVAVSGTNLEADANLPLALQGKKVVKFTDCDNQKKAITFSSSTAGTYNITHSVSDSGAGTYTSTTANFVLTVNAGSSGGGGEEPPADTTPPVLSLPNNMTVEATGPSGAAVTYNASAEDAVDGSVAIDCDRASGSSFPLGPTTVNCSSSDTRNNVSNGSFTVTVSYDFTGFFQPIDNNGVFNKAKVGSTVPVKFSLGGDQGMAIFAQGYPMVSKPIACGVNPAVDTIEEYAPTGTTSGLKYDATAGQYIYNWKTDGVKATECRQLIVKLADGTVKTANFNFFK